MDVCSEHSGNCVKIAEHDKKIDAMWRVIDQMRAWVILGMGGLLVQCAFFIINLITKKPA